MQLRELESGDCFVFCRETYNEDQPIQENRYLNNTYLLCGQLLINLTNIKQTDDVFNGLHLFSDKVIKVGRIAVVAQGKTTVY